MTALFQVIMIDLVLAGGVLLLWVCWKMWSELQSGHGQETLAFEGAGESPQGATTTVPNKTFAQAAWQIVIADVSMSLDNVLAVAGAAREHPGVLVFGLILSIALMGVAANFIANLLQKYRWIAYVGLLVILYVAGHMIYRGSLELLPYVTGA